METMDSRFHGNDGNRMMKKYFMSKNPFVKNILSALAVAVFGYVLLNITFLLDFLFQSATLAIIGLFTPVDAMMVYGWLPPAMHIAFVAIITLISLLIFKSKLPDLYKAIYMTVPAAVGYVTLGILLYRWPVVVYSVGTIITIAILYLFYRTKQHWLYYYALILVALTLTIFTFLGGEI